ncbi:hypothetical protein GQ44DRAFT_602609 [Phaeosphaeriaceae sp. PMI808]|nr:hypothetical protein GQ44DRAFT_602609 [Phaeosphaeriaceae sp. PMI808]
MLLLSRGQRLPWLSSLLLFSTVASAAIFASNTSTASPRSRGPLPLRRTDGNQSQIADLVPLTREAVTRSFEGSLRNTNFSNAVNITSGEIAFISCNPADYPGNVDPQRVFKDAFETTVLTAVILYSTASDYCGYDLQSSNPLLNTFPILSMTSKQASASLLESVKALDAQTKFTVKVQGQQGGGSSGGSGSGGDNSGNSNPNYPNSNPLGPSPSTAVAMIILYSITGIITALFLVIIITGAVRAHRHPERYGPRDVLGRPRQSRARGLGRAILDTIPIVKFGEKEPPKPTDVELASTAEASHANSTDESGNQTTPAANESNNTPKAADNAATTPEAPKALAEEHQEGIAPAQPANVAGATGDAGLSHDENLGCSICTEDFEKGQDLRVLPCDHKFHPECVDPWLLNVSGTCPLCRVDLRPVTSHDSVADQEPSEPTPAVAAAELEAARRHRTAFRDIISLRYRPNATPQERIYYLRQLRNQHRNVAEPDPSASTEDVAAADRRRSKRLSARLSDVFGGRGRRERSPGAGAGGSQVQLQLPQEQEQQQGESSRSGGGGGDATTTTTTTAVVPDSTPGAPGPASHSRAT